MTNALMDITIFPIVGHVIVIPREQNQINAMKMAYVSAIETEDVCANNMWKDANVHLVRQARLVYRRTIQSMDVKPAFASEGQTFVVNCKTTCGLNWEAQSEKNLL